jgi:hypothetical protein
MMFLVHNTQLVIPRFSGLISSHINTILIVHYLGMVLAWTF